MVIGDILDEEGLKVEAEIKEMRRRAIFVHLDVTDPEQWRLDRTVNPGGPGDWTKAYIGGRSTCDWKVKLRS